MIAELLTHLTTSCHPAARRLGYLGELIAIESRHRRNHEAWQPHLAASREAILGAADRCAERHTAVIMGAGLLLDVPLADLAKRFRKVVLLDVAVLRKTSRTISKHPNVEWRYADVTGVIDQIYHASKDSALPAPAFDAAALANTDLLVSTNILSQLPILPSAWVRRKALADERAIKNWSRKIMEHHLELFRSFAGKRCLIADISRVWTDRQGNVEETENLLTDLRLPNPDNQWQWQVAPLGELSRTSAFHTNVGSFSRF